MIAIDADNLSDALSKIPDVNRLVCLRIPGKQYYDTVESLTRYILKEKESFWAYITATRPFESFIRRFREINTAGNVKYVDVISHAANVAQKDDRCSYIPSPTMLEYIIMELEDIFETVPSGYTKFVVIDSLTTLTIYNDPEVVVEFFYQMVNKTASAHAHVISLLVKEECDRRFIDRILHLHDEIVEIEEKEHEEDITQSSSTKKRETEREKIIREMDWDHEKDLFKENRI